MIARESRFIAWFALALLAFGGGYLLWGPAWLPWDVRAGAPFGQSLGILAAVLMLASLAYLPVRRSREAAPSKPRAQFFHTLVGTAAVVLAVLHSHAALGAWSALVLLAALALLASGLYGRVVSPGRLGDAFGRSAAPYAAVTSDAGPEMAALVEDKRALLAALDPDADEGRFVLRTHHWTGRPAQALRYWRLGRRERRLVAANPASAAGEIGLAERLWRRLHLVFAALCVAGIAAHVVTTVFFAGYVADGREITWWHLAEW